MNLNEEIRVLLASFNTPADIAEQIARALEEVESSKIAPGLEVGARAPGFRLRNHHGQEVGLADKLAQGPVVVTFFRGAWCPICNLQVAALTRAMPEIRAVGASVIGIHPDSTPMTLPEDVEGFELARDPDQQVIRDYRVQFRIPENLQALYIGSLDFDLAQRNADGSWDLPVPGTFVLGGDGVVRERHVTADFSQRMEPEDVLAALNRGQ